MTARATQVPPFTALAPVFDQAGFAHRAVQTIQRYLSYALEQGWAGRRVVDVGCRTGAASWWLAEQGYRVTGVDEHPALIKVAETRLTTRELALSNAPDFIECDLRALDTIPGPADLLLAIDGALHAANSLRELETILAGMYTLLDEGKGVIFDMETIGGLAASAEIDTMALYDDPQTLTILAQPRFNFETFTRTTRLTIWQRGDSDCWQRADEAHTARGYPVQAIRTVLERCGFELHALLSTDMQPVDPGGTLPERVVFVAAK